MGISNRAALLPVLLGITLSVSAASFANASTVRAPAMTRPPAHGAAKAKGFVYACVPSENSCSVYDTNGNLVGTLTDGLSAPAGTMANTQGLLYIANATGANVAVFANGGTTPVETLADPGEEPGDVAVSKKLVVVSNEYGISSSPPNVAVYKKGATSPSYVLNAPGAFQGIGVAIDTKGNCYWSYNADSSSGGHIIEFAGCKPKSKAVDLGLTLGDAGGLAFDGDGNLWFTDQSSGLYRCAGVSSCTLVAGGFSDPLAIHFNKGATTLYLADPTTGIYTITGFASNGRRKLHPAYVVTPFAAAINVYGVTPSPT